MAIQLVRISSHMEMNIKSEALNIYIQGYFQNYLTITYPRSNMIIVSSSNQNKRKIQLEYFIQINSRLTV